MANTQTTVPLFTSGQVLTAAQQNTSAGTGVPVFATTTTRDAAFGGSNKALAEGQLCYIEASDVVQYYSGSAWATVGPTTAGGMTLLSTTTLTGASTTVSSIDQTYTALQIYMFGAYSATASGYLRCYINGDSTSGNYFTSYQRYRGGTTQTQDDTFSFSGFSVLNSASNKVMNAVLLPNYAGSQSKPWSVIGSGITDNSGAGGWFGGGIWNSTTAISSLQFINSGGSWSGGTVLIYGVK